MTLKSKRSLENDVSPRKRFEYGLDDNRNRSSRVTHTTTTNITAANTTTTASDPSTTCFERLTKSLSSVNAAFTTMNEQFDQLKKVDDSLSRFNDAFGAFLFGLSANGATIHWPNAPGKIDFETYSSWQDRSKSIGTDLLGNKKGTAATTKTSSSSSTGNAQSSDTQSTHKTLKFATKINIRKIIDHLPLKYREQTEHMKTMETVLRALRSKPEGMNMATIVEQVKLPKYRVNDCLNALVHSKDVHKHNPKGQLAVYRLDPVRYPSN
ncbi:uncharacterized protein BX664DRAFT_347676 [Halteromyces radiatus]|uniref:uncharacterized protein n=1 Tax=Halteromyces radiatus TaxID=101107 RepID=UPI00221F725A|nr:uncharacterized protein BX664DRAFT_347676 [Halteromyces radiatus]KAI8097717.1 hypothetical protein BX664DRAFT_347676 [Halteromyces radiatus]